MFVAVLWVKRLLSLLSRLRLAAFILTAPLLIGALSSLFRQLCILDTGDVTRGGLLDSADFSNNWERENRIQKEGGGLIPSDPFCWVSMATSCYCLSAAVNKSKNLVHKIAQSGKSAPHTALLNLLINEVHSVSGFSFLYSLTSSIQSAQCLHQDSNS